MVCVCVCMTESCGTRWDRNFCLQFCLLTLLNFKILPHILWKKLSKKKKTWNLKHIKAKTGDTCLFLLFSLRKSSSPVFERKREWCAGCLPTVVRQISRTVKSKAHPSYVCIFISTTLIWVMHMHKIKCPALFHLSPAHWDLLSPSV